MGTRRQTLTELSDAPVWEPARRTEVCIPDLPDTIRAQGQQLDGENNRIVPAGASGAVRPGLPAVPPRRGFRCRSAGASRCQKRGSRCRSAGARSVDELRTRAVSRQAPYPPATGALGRRPVLGG